MFRASRTRPSRPLAQRVSAIFPKGAPLCPPHTAPERPQHRRKRRASIRRSVPVRGNPPTPLHRHLALTPVGRSGPGPVGSLPTHSVGLFRCSREPCVSLPRRSRARRPSRCQTASRATLHSLRSFRALGHWETLSRASARAASRMRTTSHASPTRLRDSQQPRPTHNSRPNLIKTSTTITRPEVEIKVKKFYLGSSGYRRCGV